MYPPALCWALQSPDGLPDNQRINRLPSPAVSDQEGVITEDVQRSRNPTGVVDHHGQGIRGENRRRVPPNRLQPMLQVSRCILFREGWDSSSDPDLFIEVPQAGGQ